MKTEWSMTGWAESEPLHYNWCGLDDVYLRSGYERIPTEEGDDIVIHDLDGLHRAIGEHLARHKKALNGKEVRFLRHQMDLSQKGLGRILRVTDQTVARWEKDEVLIPGPEELLLRVTYLGHLYGNVDVKAFSEQLTEVDDCALERHYFIETESGWRSIAA